MTATDLPAPRLPDAYMPVLADACRLALEHSADDGRLMFAPDRFNYLHDMTGLACLAAVLVTEHPDNPLHGDDRLADLVRRAGRFMVAHHLSPEMNPPDHMWYDGREVHEWPFELWLTAYRTLIAGGAADLAEGWEEGLRAGATAFHRWCREIEHVRTAISPNLNVSPNHFAFFILNTLESGLVFDLPESRDLGLERARWLTRQQDPDGYWPETDGPTTSYNFITTAAVGWYYHLTGEAVFRDALERALDFHARTMYPDGSFLETIDQRVRYRPRPLENWVWVHQAFSHFPSGRAINEFTAARMDDFRGVGAHGHRMGRLAKALLHYQHGEVPAVPEIVARGAWQLARPAGMVKDGAWAVGLCGLNSRPRPHRYTMDRMNLLSVWHRDAGLIIGGGNARNQPEAATFHKRVAIDPQATPEGLAEMDVYTPVQGALDLTERGGTLTVGYWGWDGQIAAEIVDERTLRVVAGAWGRKRMMPISFTPNIRLVPGVPLATASGREVAVDGTPFDLSAGEIGQWFGQGAWRMSVPPNATLTYPFRPRTSGEPDAVPVSEMYALLTVPIHNEPLTLEIRIVKG